MNILITGHLGFIGSYLLEELKQKKDWNVFTLDLKSGQDILKMDEFPDNIDVVYHLAAQTSVIDSVSKPQFDAEMNIIATIKLLLAYTNAKFIFTSSGGAIQETVGSPYGLSKRCCEDYIKMLHENYVICRLANVYGKGGHGVLEKWKAEKEITIYGDGKSTRDYVYIDDIVDGLLKAMEWGKGTYSLGGGKSIEILKLAKMFDKKISFGPTRKGELEYSEVKNITPGWEPKFNIEDYINEQ